MPDQNVDQQSEKYEKRRRFVRQSLVVAVYFDGGATTGLATTRDIGLGGLYMATETDLPVNSTIRMRLSFVDRELEFDGIVTYCDKGQGVGVRFQNLTQEAEDFLRRVLPEIETSAVNIGRKERQ